MKQKVCLAIIFIAAILLLIALACAPASPPYYKAVDESYFVKLLELEPGL